MCQECRRKGRSKQMWLRSVEEKGDQNRCDSGVYKKRNTKRDVIRSRRRGRPKQMWLRSVEEEEDQNRCGSGM